MSGCSQEKWDSFSGQVCGFWPATAYGLSGAVAYSEETVDGSVVAVSCQIW